MVTLWKFIRQISKIELGTSTEETSKRLFMIISREMVFVEKIDELTPDCLNDVYKDFANYLGMEIASKLYHHYRGLQITFP